MDEKLDEGFEEVIGIGAIVLRYIGYMFTDLLGFSSATIPQGVGIVAQMELAELRSPSLVFAFRILFVGIFSVVYTLFVEGAWKAFSFVGNSIRRLMGWKKKIYFEMAVSIPISKVKFINNLMGITIKNAPENLKKYIDWESASKTKVVMKFSVDVDIYFPDSNTEKDRMSSMEEFYISHFVSGTRDLSTPHYVVVTPISGLYKNEMVMTNVEYCEYLDFKKVKEVDMEDVFSSLPFHMQNQM